MDDVSHLVRIIYCIHTFYLAFPLIVSCISDNDENIAHFFLYI